jgi:hypothetical protein
MNDNSSRSHVVFRVVRAHWAATPLPCIADACPCGAQHIDAEPIEQQGAERKMYQSELVRARAPAVNAAPHALAHIATQSFVDLAGSERVRGVVRGEEVRETHHINTSLLSLGSVIDGIVGKKSCVRLAPRPPPPDAPSHSHVSFWECTLTKLLQSSLSGRARGVLICTISPVASNFQTSRNTLFFAKRAVHVRSAVRSNVVAVDESTAARHQTDGAVVSTGPASANADASDETDDAAAARADANEARIEFLERALEFAAG